jgi:diguanylate cyclase (GGDEF)-like protein
MQFNSSQTSRRWAIWAPTILVLALAVVLVVETAERAARRIGVDIEEESFQIHVIGLADAGPAMRAGLRVGDRLVSLDAKRLRTIEDFDWVAASFERGRPVQVVIERDDASATLAVVPGMPAGWGRTAGRIAVALLSLAIGSIALVGRPDDFRSRLLSALFLLIAIEFTLPRGLWLGSIWTTVGPIMFYVGTGAQLALELHLAALLPRPSSPSSWRKRIVAVAYLIGLTVALLGSATYLIEGTRPDLLPWSVYQLDELIHQIVLPAWATTLLVLLGYAARRAPNRRGRLQAGLVLLGVLPWSIYILVGWWLGYPDRGSADGWAMALPLLVLCFPIAVFVAISRYRLFDLEFVVRRGLVYSSLTTVLIALFYAALGAGGVVFSRYAGDDGPSAASLATATLLLGLLFAPLRRGLQLLIDRSFFPEREAMRRRLVDLAGELPAFRDPVRMGEHLVAQLCEIYRISSATLLLADPEGRALSRIAGCGPRFRPAAQAREIRIDRPWVTQLQRVGKPVFLEQLGSAGTTADLTHWTDRPCIVAPLLAGKRLVAALILGEKRRATAYTREEIELLGLVAHHCAVAFDRARLERSATYEGLTGLLRREAVLDFLAREIARARRYQRPLSVALADIDHFKRINDRYGHLQGDRVLQQVAQAINARVRRSDAVGRYGGEEFLLVFPETGLADATSRADQLRSTVEQLQLADDDEAPIKVCISVGVAELGAAPDEIARAVSDLLLRADRGLYRAKQAGRNRVEAEPSPAPRRLAKLG